MAGFYPRLLAWPGSGPHALAYALGFTSGKEAARTTPRRCYTTARPVNKINKKNKAKKWNEKRITFTFCYYYEARHFWLFSLWGLEQCWSPANKMLGRKIEYHPSTSLLHFIPLPVVIVFLVRQLIPRVRYIKEIDSIFYSFIPMALWRDHARMVFHYQTNKVFLVVKKSLGSCATVRYNFRTSANGSKASSLLIVFHAVRWRRQTRKQSTNYLVQRKTGFFVTVCAKWRSRQGRRTKLQRLFGTTPNLKKWTR